MIMLFQGEDSLRLTQEVVGLKKRFLAKTKSAINLVELDVEEVGAGPVFEELQSLPLFAETKLVVVKGFLRGATKDDFEKLLPHAEREASNTDLVVVFCENEKVKTSKLAKWLASQKHSKTFPKLQGYDFSAWAKEQVQQLGVEIEPQALEMLVIRSRGDSWWLYNNLQKLANYAGDAKITNEHVMALTQLKVDPEIFKTIDAVAEKDSTKALHLLHQHMENGENELYVLSMITYQFNNLLQVKHLQEQGMNIDQIQKVTKLHPFVVKKSLAQSRNFSIQQLIAIFNKLAEVDGKIKTGKIEPSVALDLLVVGLTA